MSGVDTQQFAEAVVRLGLVTQTQIDALIPKVEGDLRRLASTLIKAALLTPFQAEAVLANRAAALQMGSYIILDRIGAGGMGTVYRARHVMMKRVVALKVMTHLRSADAQRGDRLKQRFYREVEAAAQLQHPNIVISFDAGEANGTPFMAMELVEGTDLSALIKSKGPLPWREAAKLLLQVAEGLRYAHGLGVVHRDIKPGNLLLGQGGVVKILDMGLARITAEIEKSHDDLTTSGVMIGTVAYMSPEQAKDAKRADNRADIYALGCTLYYLMTAKLPFPGDSTIEIIVAKAQQPTPDLAAHVLELPPQLQDVFVGMVEKEPAARYQRIEDVIEDLKAILAGQVITHRESDASPLVNELQQRFEDHVIADPDPSILTGNDELVHLDSLPTLDPPAAADNGHLEPTGGRLGIGAKIGIAAAALVILVIAGIAMSPKATTDGDPLVAVEPTKKEGSGYNPAASSASLSPAPSLAAPAPSPAVTTTTSTTDKPGVTRQSPAITTNTTTITPLPLPAGAAEWFVSPDGQPDNAGTRQSPWDLASTLAGDRTVRPGDTVYLDGGIYRYFDRNESSRGFPVAVAGTQDRPIHIRAKPGERTRIDGGMDMTGSHVWVHDMEFFVSENIGPDGQMLPDRTHHGRPAGRIITSGRGGHNNRLINCVMHAIGDSAVTGGDSDLYGCVLYDIGLSGGRGGWLGNAVVAAGEQEIRDCIFTGRAVHALSMSKDGVVNSTYEGNIFQDKHIDLRYEGTAIQSIRMNQNCFYNANIQIGSPDAPSKGLVLEDNVIVGGGVNIENVQGFKQSGNVEVANSQRLPNGQPIVRLRANQYDPNRAHVACFNWQQRPVVVVDPRTFLAVGDRYQFMDPTDLWGKPVHEGEWRVCSVCPVQRINACTCRPRHGRQHT